MAGEPVKTDFWGDIFDLAATAVIFLGWISTIGLCIGFALMGVTLLLGKPVTFSMGGPAVLLAIAVAFPIVSIIVGRILRRHARTSTPARVGIAALAFIYGAFAALRVTG